MHLRKEAYIESKNDYLEKKKKAEEATKEGEGGEGDAKKESGKDAVAEGFTTANDGDERDNKADADAAAVKLLRDTGRKCADSRVNAAATDHAFWDTQPVPKFADDSKNGELSKFVGKAGPMDATKKVADVKTEGYGLPSSFEWVTMDLTQQEEIDEVYTLLAENYVS